MTREPPRSIPFTPHETYFVPARTRLLIKARIGNNRKSGYVPRIEAGPGLYAGGCLVTNQDGRAPMFIINITTEDLNITIPPIMLGNYDRTITPIRTIQANSEEKRKDQTRHRINKIKQCLDLDGLNTEERDSVINLIEQFPNQFHLHGDKLSNTFATTHKIPTINDIPINVKQFRLPPNLRGESQKQIQEMLNNDIIEESDSPYNSPVLIVPKKPDSQGKRRWRLVIDFRALNEKTIAAGYPLSNITDILDQLGSSKYFLTLDLASGFHQIPIDPKDAFKTAFSTTYGHYQYKCMPMGLKEAPSIFQSLMNKILSGLQGVELFIYMDDIVVYATSIEEHTMKMRKLFRRLKTAGLTLQPEKCLFLRKEVTYLGHVISEKGVKPDPKKIEAVMKFPRLKNAKNIKQFLGLVGYYRRFIPDFSKIAKPLTNLLKKGAPFIWGYNQEEAFEKLKQILCTEPLLRYPDFNEPFILTTDASDYALGAILSQGKIGKDPPIAYASRTLNDAEIKYTTTEKELLAMVFAIQHFRPYLFRRKFTLVTDHRTLVWLRNLKDPFARIGQWELKLREYDFNVEYRLGRVNANADALSRNPVLTLKINELNLNYNELTDSEQIISEAFIEKVFLITDKKENCLDRDPIGLAQGPQVPEDALDRLADVDPPGSYELTRMNNGLHERIQHV